MPISTACPTRAKLAELGLDDLPDDAVLLIEWPERAPALLPQDRWEIAFKVDAEVRRANFRDVRITGHGACAARLERLVAGRAVSRGERLTARRGASALPAMRRAAATSASRSASARSS